MVPQGNKIRPAGLPFFFQQGIAQTAGRVFQPASFPCGQPTHVRLPDAARQAQTVGHIPGLGGVGFGFRAQAVIHAQAVQTQVQSGGQGVQHHGQGRGIRPAGKAQYQRNPARQGQHAATEALHLKAEAGGDGRQGLQGQGRHAMFPVRGEDGKVVILGAPDPAANVKAAWAAAFALGRRARQRGSEGRGECGQASLTASLSRRSSQAIMCSRRAGPA